jgi:predicted nucleotidyltransferase
VVAIEFIKAHRDEILCIAAKRGARNVRLFGSVALGQATADSDVDFLIHLDEDRSLLDHVALKLDLEELLGCSVDVVIERGLPHTLRERVLGEAIPL